MGALTTALAQVEAARPGPRCSVALLVARLSKADADELRGAMQAGLPHQELATAVHLAYGEKISGATLSRHIRQRCACQGN